MKRAKTAAVHLDLLIDLKHLALRYYEPINGQFFDCEIVSNCETRHLTPTV